MLLTKLKLYNVLLYCAILTKLGRFHITKYNIIKKKEKAKASIGKNASLWGKCNNNDGNTKSCFHRNLLGAHKHSKVK